MKNKINQLKNFVCFYMTIPLFVFMTLAVGAKAVTLPTPREKFPKEYIGFTESEVNPSSYIYEEIQNPDGTLPIIARDLSKEYNIINSTNEVINESELLSAALPHSTSSPVVLVVHTHATECYASPSQSFSTPDKNGFYGYYDTSVQTRSDNTDINMIAIGEVFCRVLAENGIEAIQCRTMHDKDDYNSAYANSRKSIAEYLESYPSIEYIIDIHRDSLGGNGKEKTKTYASEIEDCAQVMLVAGCNGYGVSYPIWEENLSLALKYKRAMDEKYPSLSRPIYLRYSKYNLDMAVGSLLLEVGSCANTFDEAEKAAALAAECFAELLK